MRASNSYFLVSYVLLSHTLVVSIVFLFAVGKECLVGVFDIYFLSMYDYYR